MIDDAHKASTLSQTTINTQKSVREEKLKHSQNDGSGEMVVAFTIAEITYLIVSLFRDLVLPFSWLYLWYQIVWLRYLPCFQHNDKSGHAFSKIIHHILVKALQAELF